MQESCNRGAVTFDVAGDLQGASMCQCGQCQKQSGGVRSSAYVTDNGDYYEIADGVPQREN